jgi:hypothetical protein
MLHFILDEVFGAEMSSDSDDDSNDTKVVDGNEKILKESDNEEEQIHEALTNSLVS